MATNGTETPFIIWLEDLLRRRGWSGNYLGERCGLSGQTISRWRHGTGRPSRENVIALSAATGVPEDDITALLMPYREAQRSLASYLATALPAGMTRAEARLLVHMARAYREWEGEITDGRSVDVGEVREKAVTGERRE